MWRFINGMGLRRYLKTLALFAVGMFYFQLVALMRHVDVQKTEELFFITNNHEPFAKRAYAATDARVAPIQNQSNITSTNFHDQNSNKARNFTNKEPPRGKVQDEVPVVEEKRKLVPAVAVNSSAGCLKKVHLWCGNSGELGFSHGVHIIQCPGSVCNVQLSVDMSFDTMQTNEALIFYHWSHWDWDAMHAHRPPGQKWVFYTLESPRHTRKHVVPPDRYYNTSYDYIMSYRYDSDFRADYGQYIDGKPEIAANDTRNWAANRTKLVAWMASNCNGPSWPRHQFVKDLASYVPVDMYGRCGHHVCRPGSKKCDQTLAQYKFYLALENSECTDYITEKFWIQALVRRLVPIVYGPPRSDYEKVAPPGSFIHIQDFETLQELADYLKKVDADDALYDKFFEWKKRGSLKPYGTCPNIMCQLGDRLVKDRRAVAHGNFTPRTQPDWKVWWADSCKRRGVLPA